VNPTYDLTFSGFIQFKPDEVQDYIGKFAAVPKAEKSVLEHAYKWLKGRPRWPATFLSRWMQGDKVGATDERPSRSNLKELSLLSQPRGLRGRLVVSGANRLH